MTAPYGYLRVVQVRSDRGVSCADCGQSFAREFAMYAEHINHFLGHGYEILSTGSEGGGGDVVSSVTLLGKPRQVKDLLDEIAAGKTTEEDV